MPIQFDASLGQQVEQFINDVDDLIPASAKSAPLPTKLISLLDCDEKSVKENALAFLAFANQSPVNKDVAREDGLIKLFVKYIHPSNLSKSVPMVKHATMGLMFLSNHADANKLAFSEDNGIDTLFELVRDLIPFTTSPPEGVKREDVFTILSHSLNMTVILASNAAVREKMGSVANFLVLNTLLNFELAGNPDLQQQIQEKALSSVNNICIHKENKESARVSGCIESVLKLLKSSKPSIQDSALRMIYNMTIVDANREAIRRAEGLEKLVAMLQGNPETIVLLTLKALANMAFDRQTIEYFVQHNETVLTPFLNLLPLKNNDQVLDQVLSVIQNLVSEDGFIEEVAKTNVMNKIVPSVKGMPLTTTTHQSILVKATCIISALITIEDVQQSFAESGVIDLLIELLQSQLPEVRREAARSLANATPYYDDIRQEVGTKGGVKLLIDLLLSADKEIVRQAARSLVNLARNTHNEESIFEAKGLEHSIRLISNAEKELKMLGTKLLVNLTLNEKARIGFCQKGGLTIVIQLLTNPDPELQLQGTKIVTNLAISGRNRKIMNENVPELIPSVKQLVSSSVNDIKVQAEVALNNIAFPYENSYEGLDFGLEEAIPTLLTETHYEREDEDDDEDKEESENRRRQEEEELRLAAENEIQERKRIMEEEMKRIEVRRKQEEEKRIQEEEEKRKQKEEAEKQRQLAEAMEKLRIEEERKQKEEAERKRLEEEKRQKEEKERLEKERIAQLSAQQKEKEEAEARLLAEKLKREEEERRVAQLAKEAEEKRIREEEERKKKEREIEEEKQRVLEEERKKKEREAEEARRRAEEEEKVRKMQEEILAREEEVKRKKEEEEQRRKKEEQDKKLRDMQDKASQESARLAQEAAKAQKRTHIVQEIMQVETNYVKNLGLVVRKFLNPLVSAAASKRPIITQDKIKQIFSVVEIIHNFNSMLADGLTSRIKRWLVDKKEILLIGDIFVKSTNFMDAYSQYINNYNFAIKNLNESKKNNPAFAQFVRKVEADPELQDRELENLLINPIQQLPRYIMLLSDLIRCTNDDHPDYKSLQEALEKIKKITSYINEKKRDAEDAMAMVSIHQTLHGKVPSNFLASHRKFVKEGNINFGSSSGSFKDKDPVVFLFNDMIMMTIKHPTKPNEYKFRYSAQFSSITTIEDFPRVNNGFMIKAAQWWIFSCPTAAEKSVWMETISKILSNLPKEALQSSKSK
eukprot:gene2719-3376_t